MNCNFSSAHLRMMIRETNLHDTTPLQLPSSMIGKNKTKTYPVNFEYITLEYFLQ